MIEVAIAGRPVLDDLDQPTQALTDGIGEGSVDEGHDVYEVRPQGTDKGPHRGDATAQGRGHPASEELRNGSGR